MKKHASCLIVDDHPILRKGIRDLLIQAAGFSKVIEAKNAREALSTVAREPLDLVVLDVSLPDKHGLEVLKEIRLLNKKLPVLMLSLFPEHEFALRALKIGASGYITKDRAPSELLAAVKEVLAGRRYITQSLADLLAIFLDEGQPATPHAILSNRELQVLQLFGQGKPVSAIADEMALSVKTISTYRARILDKLNLPTTAALIRYAISHDLAL